jgi:hypothetical protein
VARPLEQVAGGDEAALPSLRRDGLHGMGTVTYGLFTDPEGHLVGIVKAEETSSSSVRILGMGRPGLASSPSRWTGAVPRSRSS